MAGTGNSTPQVGDAGVIPVPQAGEMPEASVYRPLHMQEESDTQNVSASVGILPSLVYPDPSNFIGQRQSNVESLPQQQGDCKAPKAQVRAAHTAAADSNAESDVEEDQEEPVKDEKVPPEVEDLEAEYDVESIHIDGDEYVMVD
ncbi:hypothetical protein C0995_002631, partial [Termitomyces sp. Mi166